MTFEEGGGRSRSDSRKLELSEPQWSVVADEAIIW